MKKGDKGFDISHHQDVTYEEMLAAIVAGFKFIVIRASHGVSSIDEKFMRHYAAAKKAGLFVFVYFFMYYADREKSAQEVANVLRVLKGLQIDGCVFLDMENRGEYAKGQHLSMLSKAEATNRALYAIAEIQKAGFTAGLYADVDWMKNEMNMEAIPDDVIIWAADWHGALDYKGRCEIRQYTSTGTIAGIGTGSVDLDELLVDYPFAVPEAPTAPKWTVGRILKLLKKRQTGDDVKGLQAALTAAGFLCGKIDGDFGPKTDAALRAWQEKNPDTGTKGKPDGKAGKKTIEKLGGEWSKK